MPGPTLNSEYNQLLVKWGRPNQPECEDCGCDLTEKPVIETRCWVCEDCAKKICDYYEDPNYERRQMGLTAL